MTSLLLSFLPAEFQRQESVRSQHKGIQLYDTPYEPEGQNVDSDSESTVSLRLRESKLPQDDDRPADEYDQPWEWNRVTIPALAGRSNVPAGEAVAEESSALAEVSKAQVSPAWPGRHQWSRAVLSPGTHGPFKDDSRFLRERRTSQRETPVWHCGVPVQSPHLHRSWSLRSHLVLHSFRAEFPICN